MQCPICKKDLEIKNKKIGENEAGEAIYNEFAICRDCKKQWNLDKQREKKKKLAKEAFDLITFITKGEYDQKLADETVGIPADTTNTEWPAMVECAKPVIEQSTNRFTWACGVESNVDMTPVIKENFIKLMAGSITADEFVSTMQDATK